MVEDWVGRGGKTDRKMEAGKQWATMSGLGECKTVLYWIRGPFIIFLNIHLIMGLYINCTASDISLKIRYVYIYKGTFGEVPPVSSGEYSHRGECVMCIQEYHQSSFDTGGVRRVHSELGVQLE